MIVAAPDPSYAPREPPPWVDHVAEVERAGARVRAWVIDPDAGEPRGTVFLLHGIRDSKDAQLPRARRLAARGYRAVAVDSRGHGESSGAWLTFGVEEAQDLEALADALDARGLLLGPLGVVGFSYGGSIAVQHAALDDRVEAVVAVAPFASLREVVPEYVDDALGPLRGLRPAWWVDHLVEEAGERAGFDPDQACPRCAARRVEAPLLLIHGRDDRRIPWQQSRAIHEAAAGPSRLMVVDGATHMGIARAAGVSEAIDGWLDRHL